MCLVVSVILSDLEDRFTDIFKLLLVCRELINCLRLCNLGKP